MADTAIPDDGLDYQNRQGRVKGPEGEAMPFFHFNNMGLQRRALENRLNHAKEIRV